jgi:tRNA 2-(methylsulfanyl)-N6-isopentenyladenosine37 hydroxylase
MLCLKTATNPEWINVALQNVELVLIDHAHCEKKAASTGLALLSSYPEKSEISLTMSDLVSEEIDHYKSVVSLMLNRNIPLRKDIGDPYVKQLLSHVRTYEPVRLLDRLLTAGIIEARSCERLQLLGENLPDPSLKQFYTELSASEAGHYVTFIKLSKLYFPEEEVKQRLNQLSDIEADIIKSLNNHPSIHG